MTTIYLIRHSKTQEVNVIESNIDLQLKNEKNILSIEGEEIAKKKFDNDEFRNIDILLTSYYIRAIETAKYLTNKNNIPINIVEDLGERKFGIENWNELPEKFEARQFTDDLFKIGHGESQKEVRERMYRVLDKILELYEGKRIAIVSHSTALAFLLGKWCEIKYNDFYKFKGNVFFDGKWNYCQTFKLTFDGKELKNIQTID